MSEEISSICSISSMLNSQAGSTLNWRELSLVNYDTCFYFRYYNSHMWGNCPLLICVVREAKTGKQQIICTRENIHYLRKRCGSHSKKRVSNKLSAQLIRNKTSVGWFLSSSFFVGIILMHWGDLNHFESSEKNFIGR